MGSSATLRPRGRILALWIALLAALPACGAFDALKARRVARDANALYREADYRGAIVKYREAIELDDDTPNVHLNLGYALFNIYDPSGGKQERRAAADAVAAFERHLEAAPDDDKARQFRIKTLLRAAPNDEELADKAYALFVEMLSKRPDDEEIRQYLVSLLIDTRRYPQAVEYFGPLLKEKPSDLGTMKILAVIADKSDQFDAAIEWYRRRADAGTDVAHQASLFYELGTYVWNLLHYQPDRTASIAGIRLADQGIEASRRAMDLKKDYAEAMVYANLLYLERAAREFGEDAKYFDQQRAYDLRVQASKLLGRRKGTGDAAANGNGAAHGDEGTERD